MSFLQFIEFVLSDKAFLHIDGGCVQILLQSVNNGLLILDLLIIVITLCVGLFEVQYKSFLVLGKRLSCLDKSSIVGLSLGEECSHLDIHLVQQMGMGSLRLVILFENVQFY